jgi:site-specific recombinase XerD
MKEAKIEFKGPLAKELVVFSSLLHSTGGKHGQTLAVARRLDQFLAIAYPEVTSLTKDVLRAWFDTFKHLKYTSQARYRTATFQFCKFLHSRDFKTATQEEFEPLRHSRTFRPHIFSIEQIKVLLQSARKLAPRPCDPLRHSRTELIVGLLYSSGLRIGEIVRLLVRDYESDSGILTIRETKYAKSRIVPLSDSAQRLIDCYLVQRVQLGLKFKSQDPILCGPGGRRPCLGSIQRTLVRLMRQCGFKPNRGRCGPRIHDIRHTFAVHRLLQWYREEKDVQILLPRLVTYMGHRGLESTQLYLSVTPDVLREASTRFAQFAATCLESEAVHP